MPQPEARLTHCLAAGPGLYGRHGREAALVDMVNDGVEDVRRRCSWLIHHGDVSRGGRALGVAREGTLARHAGGCHWITAPCRRRARPSIYRSCPGT